MLLSFVAQPANIIIDKNEHPSKANIRFFTMLYSSLCCEPYSNGPYLEYPKKGISLVSIKGNIHQFSSCEQKKEHGMFIRTLCYPTIMIYLQMQT